jgi:ribose 5-phosphate isomerase A
LKPLDAGGPWTVHRLYLVAAGGHTQAVGDVDSRHADKQRAAEAAVALVESGMVLGIGGGSTAALAAARLAERVGSGALRGITCVACGESVARELQRLGLRHFPLSERPQIDLTIDGADEVDGHLDLVKGAGGALLREKMVAQASHREVIVVDDSKLSPRLGTRAVLPVEVFPFGWRAEEHFLHELGAAPMLRLRAGQPFLTDEGNFILDCAVGPIAEPQALAATLQARAGIAAHGLFLGLATEVLVAGGGRVKRLRAHHA